jgi:Protein of unknown function (DUF4038)/Putative collagen-binding domain of a collagenase
VHQFASAGGGIVTPGQFPLSIHSSGRYLVDARGAPFFIHGDTGWSIEAQLTLGQIDAYLSNRQAKGFNAVLFETFEHSFSDQSPAYRNVYGADPFSTMTDFGSTKVEAYWRVVDYIVESCLQRGMVCFITPAYWGYNGGSEGWWTEINAESNADLQSYGAWLQTRYQQPNIIWVMGGDWNGTNSTNRDKQWNIVTGMRSVRTDQIITAHNGRSDSDAYSTWNGYAGFNLNSVYISVDGSDGYSESATARGRSMPFFMIEAGYENDGAYFLASIQSILSGACGHFFGNNPLWRFGSGSEGAASSIATDMDTTGAAQMGYLKSLLTSYRWHKLVAKTDTSLVTSALGSGTSRICPMLSSETDFALIWIPGTPTVTVNMAAFTSKATLRARWWDYTTGSYAAIANYANSGTQNFTPGTADKVLVID